MWKDIEGFEGRYGISDLGEVQNVNTKKILTPTSDKDGYLHIGLRKLGDLKHQSWHHTIEDAVNARNNALIV